MGLGSLPGTHHNKYPDRSPWFYVTSLKLLKLVCLCSSLWLILSPLLFSPQSGDREQTSKFSYELVYRKIVFSWKRRENRKIQLLEINSSQKIFFTEMHRKNLIINFFACVVMRMTQEYFFYGAFNFCTNKSILSSLPSLLLHLHPLKYCLDHPHFFHVTKKQSFFSVSGFQCCHCTLDFFCSASYVIFLELLFVFY